MFSDDRFYQYDADSNTLGVTEIMDWYGEDFEEAAGSVAEYVAGIKEEVPTDPKPDVEFIEYDWKLNSQAHAPAPATR